MIKQRFQHVRLDFWRRFGLHHGGESQDRTEDLGELEEVSQGRAGYRGGQHIASGESRSGVPPLVPSVKSGGTPLLL